MEHRLNVKASFDIPNGNVIHLLSLEKMDLENFLTMLLMRHSFSSPYVKRGWHAYMY